MRRLPLHTDCKVLEEDSERTFCYKNLHNQNKNLVYQTEEIYQSTATGINSTIIMQITQQSYCLQIRQLYFFFPCSYLQQGKN